ncbi:MAG: hypothetical protein INF18_10220 [Methylobacterium sp.]|nr:hypothetical protein [Methylobacterium sp.]MCA3637623.1 hypothetical protein [Methylobacterium sp.]
MLGKHALLAAYSRSADAGIAMAQAAAPLSAGADLTTVEPALSPAQATDAP